MALVLRVKDGDTIAFRLEDGREISIVIENYSPNRTVTYIDAPKSVRIDRIRTGQKELDERAGNFSE